MISIKSKNCLLSILLSIFAMTTMVFATSSCVAGVARFQEGIGSEAGFRSAISAMLSKIQADAGSDASYAAQAFAKRLDDFLKTVGIFQSIDPQPDETIITTSNGIIRADNKPLGRITWETTTATVILAPRSCIIREADESPLKFEHTLDRLPVFKERGYQVFGHDLDGNQVYHARECRVLNKDNLPHKVAAEFNTGRHPNTHPMAVVVKEPLQAIEEQRHFRVLYIQPEEFAVLLQGVAELLRTVPGKLIRNRPEPGDLLLGEPGVHNRKQLSIHEIERVIGRVQGAMETNQSGEYILKTEGERVSLILPVGEYQLNIRWDPENLLFNYVEWSRGRDLLKFTPLSVQTGDLSITLNPSLRLTLPPISVIGDIERYSRLPRT